MGAAEIDEVAGSGSATLPVVVLPTAEITGAEPERVRPNFPAVKLSFACPLRECEVGSLMG